MIILVRVTQGARSSFKNGYRRTIPPMNKELNLAFIGGGNMATALASGLIGKRCGAHDVHIIDVQSDVRERWASKGVSVASGPDDTLRSEERRVGKECRSRW